MFNSAKLANYDFLKHVNRTQHLVFIDSNVTDYSYLATRVLPGVKVIILDPNQDGIKQITKALNLYSSPLSIHIVSHGSPGCIYLGNTQLSLDTLNEYREELKTWFNPTPFSISSNQEDKKNLYLYGCNVSAGDAGEEFISKLHYLTNATIFASTTKVGHKSLGGNWQLNAVINSRAEHNLKAHAFKLPFSQDVLNCYTNVLMADPETTNDVFNVVPGRAINIDPLSNDSDPDSDPLSITAIIDPLTGGSSNPLTNTGDTATLGNGTVVELQGDGTINVTQPIGLDNSQAFDYVVSDGTGSSIGNIVLRTDADADDVANIIDIDDDNDGIVDTQDGLKPKKVDILAIVDNSGSIDSTEFTQFAQTIDTIINLLQQDGNDYQFAVTHFSSALRPRRIQYDFIDTPSLIDRQSPSSNKSGFQFLKGLRKTILDLGDGKLNPRTGAELKVVVFTDEEQPFFLEDFRNDGFDDRQYLNQLKNDFSADIIVAGINLENPRSPAQLAAAASSQPDAPYYGAVESIPNDPDTSKDFDNNGSVDSRNLILGTFVDDPKTLADRISVAIQDTITLSALDSDNDGFSDHLDLDSDNDGITDNVEAQATKDYIEPSGISGAGFTDDDDDGLDNNYDDDDNDISVAASKGLTPVDTDSTLPSTDGVTDRLDPDSDNDTLFDITERGDGQPSSITSLIDTDGDGLLDIFEGNDPNDGFDVNDENLTGTNFNLAKDLALAADGSNAVPLTTDLLFRDVENPPANPNNPPDAIDDGPVAVTEDIPVNGNVLDNDSDQDGDLLIVKEFTIPNLGTFNAGETANIVGVGALTINTDGVFSFDPAPDYNGPVPTANYTVADPSGANDTADLSFADVTPINDPPIANDDGVFAVSINTSVSDNLLKNDSDPDTGDTITVTEFTIPGVGTFPADNLNSPPNPRQITGIGTLTIDVNGAFTFTPEPTYSGPVPAITYKITDSSGASDTASLFLAVGLNLVNGTGGSEAINTSSSNATTIGDDLIVGGAGQDTLAGGGGNDLFHFNRTSDGVDIITDFNADSNFLNEADKLDLRDLLAVGGELAGIAIQNNPFDDGYIEAKSVGGTSTIIQVDFDPFDSSNDLLNNKNIVLLENVAANAIDASDFLF